MAIGFKVSNNFGKASGTSLQGEIIVTYRQLVAVLGLPAEGDGYKTDAEWVIEFDDGVCITVYNWKNGPCCVPFVNIEDITVWHVGGRDNTDAVGRLCEILAQERVVVDMKTVRGYLAKEYNCALEMVRALEDRNGRVSRDDLVNYCVHASEARVLDKVIKAFDAAKVV